MIERGITINDKNSRFYHHNESLALQWESLVQKYNGEIQGIVNSYIIEFKLKLKIQDNLITIYGLRQLSNNQASIHMDYLMTKRIEIEFEGLNMEGQDWRIIKQNKIMNLIYSLFNHVSHFNNDNSYTLITKKTEETPMKIIESKLWNYIKKVAGLRGVSWQNNKLKISYSNFVGAETIEHLIKNVLSI